MSCVDPIGLVVSQDELEIGAHPHAVQNMSLEGRQLRMEFNVTSHVGWNGDHNLLARVRLARQAGHTNTAVTL